MVVSVIFEKRGDFRLVVKWRVIHDDTALQPEWG